MKIKSGEKIPRFRLSSNQKRVSRSDRVIKGITIIALLRGFLCAHCRLQLSQLRRNYQRFKEMGVEVVAIGPDKVDEFVEFFDERGIPFLGLSDPRGKVLDRLGQESKLLRFGRLPALLIVDEKGVVRFTHYGKKSSDLPDIEEIIREINSIKRKEIESDEEALNSEFYHRPEETESSEEEVWGEEGKIDRSRVKR